MRYFTDIYSYNRRAPLQASNAAAVTVSLIIVRANMRMNASKDVGEVSPLDRVISIPLAYESSPKDSGRIKICAALHGIPAAPKILSALLCKQRNV